MNCVCCGISIAPPLSKYCRSCGRIRKTTDYGRALRRAWYHRDPRLTMLQNAKAGARRAGVPFDLRKEDVHIPARCQVLGMPLEVGSGKRHDGSPSIDRVVPERGYVKDNIRIISWRANRLKSDATLAELRRVVSYLRRSASA